MNGFKTTLLQINLFISLLELKLFHNTLKTILRSEKDIGALLARLAALQSQSIDASVVAKKWLKASLAQHYKSGTYAESRVIKCHKIIKLNQLFIIRAVKSGLESRYILI